MEGDGQWFGRPRETIQLLKPLIYVWKKTILKKMVFLFTEDLLHMQLSASLLVGVSGAVTYLTM